MAQRSVIIKEAFERERDNMKRLLASKYKRFEDVKTAGSDGKRILTGA